VAWRLVSLLVIAFACGLGAVTVSSARAGKPPAPIAHIPAIPAAASTGPRCPIPMRFRKAFLDAARETRLPLSLLTAVARVESEFQPGATSGAGAAAQNVLAGARYLRLQFDLLRSSDHALAAYNTGPKAVANAGGAPRDETLTYVADVTSIWRSLAGCT
jgi:soluble lytic murein transglycosylase-like protein